MGDKGSADQSGMMQAMASAQAAQEAYALGEQQLQWTQQVWNQEQPLINQSEQVQIDLAQQEQASLAQSTAESQQQWNQYLQTYAPLEQKFAAQAQDWASPAAIAEGRGQAMADVAEQGQAGLNSAAETLRSYGVNPASGRYAALYTGAQPMLGAAEAAAGTTEAQNLRLQQMGLESGAINTGRGLVNSVQGLTGVGTQSAGTGGGLAGGAAGTAQSNLSTGSTAMTAPSAWFNAGANNMNSYVNAVNGYNQSQAEFAQAGASEMQGLGSVAGSLLGLGIMKSDERDKTDIKREGTDHEGIPLYSYRYKEDPKTYPKVVGPMAQDIAKIDPRRVGAIPGSPKGTLAIRFDDGGMVSPDPQMTPTQGGGATGIPPSPIPPSQYPPGALPSNATPGGGVPAHASPSNGQATDDVPALLTADEFVIPKDVATWKGHEYFAKQIDMARRGQQQFAQRDDIGGEPAPASPQQPNFISRPPHMGTTMGAIPGMPQRQMMPA
jgi:hypothetical protein